MDYAGWELERQRQALAALLLGGGTAEDRDTSRKEERRSPEAGPMGSGAAREYAAGKGGRYAGGPDGGAFGAWEAVRTAGRDRLNRSGGPGIPVSAWEGVLGAGTVFEPGGRDTESGAPSGFESVVQKEGTSGGRTGSRAEFQTDFLRQETGGSVRDVSAAIGETSGMVRKAGRSGEFLTRGLPAPEQGEARGLTLFDTVSGGGEAAGRQRQEEAGTVRRNGGSGEGMGHSQAPVVQVLEEVSGTEVRSGSLGDAALQAEDGAKALSLAVQRDARRYDGGFTIY